MATMNLELLHSIRDYIDLDQHAADVVAAFRPRAEPHFKAVVDDFYATIEAHAEARLVITGGREQVERLKGSLTQWLGSLLSGRYDQEYLDRHARIGRVHVRIGLPQHLMFTAMSRVRMRLTRIAALVLADDPALLDEVTMALHKLLDLELAIMLGSYREDLIERQRAHERLATIGELAASVGHELRNPLGTMESSLYLMERLFEKLGITDQQVLKHHQKVTRQVELCNDTITRLLDLARDRPPRCEYVQLSSALRETISRMELPPTTRISLDVDDELRVWMDPTQIGLVMANLIRNAGEASPTGVTVTIHAGAEPGGVAIFVHDDGPGIPEQVRPHVFRALFTTRSQGTGLGLALATRIVEAHNGEVTLEEAERGTTFRVWLPLPEQG
ncbi:MAG TPA: protoglobin domain-containing protein [Polyangiaceae bacterium]|nr:protoglobin domain-containing protein [Polyangiaceae bacterium]